MWTLVIFIVAGGPSIIIDGFSKLDDCRAIGQVNVELINPRAHVNCDKTNRPPTICKRGRTAECIT